MKADGSWIPELRRWTPLTFLFPEKYVVDDQFWEDVDIEEWSRSEYEWTEDDWNGLLDFARPPRDTFERGRGDCEDYALVAASWAIANGRPGVGLAVCWKRPYPWPTHVIAFDDERVYSSGRIVEKRVDEWTETTRYRFALQRSVR